jgi:hypothetical protein
MMKNWPTIIACCCVREIVERNSPSPSDVRRKQPERPMRSGTLPRIGMPNPKTITSITTVAFADAIAVNGTILPIISSAGVIGVTMICSSVPISFSRTIAIDVRFIVPARSIMTSRPGTM